MTIYKKGHIKRDPSSGDVAVRTIFPGGNTPAMAMMEWLVASPVTGPRHTWTQEVEGWDDVFAPEPEG